MKKSSYSIAYVTASHLDLFWLGHMFSCLARGTDVNRRYVDDCLEHPERTYFIETSIFAAELARRHPDYVAKLKRLITEGRLEIGAPFVDRFENNVSGESLIRNAVIGRRLLRDMLGYDSQVSMHPDLPGYSPQLPQIYSKAGIRYYLTSRKVFPNGQVFRFQAPDGSSTLHCHFVFGYGFVPIHEIVEHIDEIDAGFPAGRIVAAGGGADLTGRDTFPGKYGARLEELIEQARDRYPFIEFSYATLAELMRDYESMDLPVKHGEVPSNWGSIASANVQVWDTNRAAEAGVLDAELLSALSSSFLGISPIPEDRGDWFGWRYDTALGFWEPPHTINRGAELEELWKLVLVPQDHNDGSREGPESTFQKVQMHERAMHYSSLITKRCLAGIARRVTPRQTGRPVMVFNQASWDRSDVVTLPDLGRNARVVDGNGDELPSQQASGRTLFLAESVPAVGYQTFYITDTDGSPAPPATTGCSDGANRIVVENRHLRVEFSKSRGHIDRIDYCPVGAAIAAKESAGWGRIQSFTESRRDVDPKIDESVPPEDAVVESVSVVSTGPLFTEVFVKGTLCDSVLEALWRVYATVPRIDLDVRLLWWGRPRQQLRLGLPMNPDLGEITYETPFYANRWPSVMDGSGPWIGDEMNCDDWQRYREVIGWVDLSGDKCGVTVSSRHAHYYIDGPNLQAVLLRSPVNCGDERRYTSNAGERRWSFSFAFHQGGWKTGASYRRGFEFTRPLMTVESCDAAPGDMPDSHSFLRLEPSNLVVTAVKSPDLGSSGDVIVRFCEMEGKACTARLKVAGGVKQVFETDLLEEDVESLAVVSPDSVTADVRPYEIRTWRLVL